jgi:hypothetical protein
MFWTLKDFAREMEVHPRTAKRWWRKIALDCIRLHQPPVGPDIIGHGAHRWEPATAARLLKLWKTYYNHRGTTPQIVRAKFAGTLTDKRQLNLQLQDFLPHIPPKKK